MITTVLVTVCMLIIAAMGGYAAWLLFALQKQKKAFAAARVARINRLKESINIIANAMQSGECNHSEGVIRLRMLLEPLGKQLQQYPAMWELYLAVQDMPTHDARHTLVKKERMRLDLIRESTEACLEGKIKLELPQLLADIETI